MTSDTTRRRHPVPPAGVPLRRPTSDRNRPSAETNDLGTLAQSSDRELRRLVKENLATDRPDHGLWTTLLRPPLVRRVRDILIEMQIGVERDLHARRDRLDQHRQANGEDLSSYYEQDYLQWRARAVAFRLMVQQRLGQTRPGSSQDNVNKAEMLAWYRKSVRRLVEAIGNHRCALDDDVQPEPADLELWKVLNEVTVPVGHERHPVAARDMFDSCWNPRAKRARHASPPAATALSGTRGTTSDDGPTAASPIPHAASLVEHAHDSG
jgi:hypothetical protein